MGFQSHFSDESAQNADTTFEHMNKFIHWMYDNNLFIKYGIIYYTTCGCIKQYICVNSMWLLYVLEFTNRVIIDRLINDPSHCRSKIDGINRANKTHLKQ